MDEVLVVVEGGPEIVVRIVRRALALVVENEEFVGELGESRDEVGRREKKVKEGKVVI